jgi:DNA-directed RNA polymerase specialized sigma24 family protein
VGGDLDGGSLERLFEERGKHLLRAAVALTGSRADGEDLLQAALERLLRNQRRVETDPEAYLRRTLYHLAADGWRVRGRWRGRLARRPASRTWPWWTRAISWSACCSSCRRGSGR